ncbi:MAG: DUF5362 family protein [Flavitalea sp.]
MEQQDSLFELQVDHQSTAFLRETAKWAKFLAIVGFIFIGLIVIVVVFAGSMLGAAMSTAYGTAGSAVGSFQVILLVAMVLIYFFPTLFLYRFASRMQVALRNNDQVTLNSSFESLKSCFKFMGILMIIILSFYALALVFGMFAAIGLS